MKLQISARIFAAIAQLRAEKSDLRTALHGVYVEPRPEGGVIIQAASGLVAGVWLDVHGKAERPAILKVDDDLIDKCGASRTLAIINDRLVVVDDQTERIEYTSSDPEWELKEKYHDLKKIIPIIDGEQSLIDAINPKLLSKIRKAIKTGTGVKRVIGVELRQTQTVCTSSQATLAPIVCTSSQAPLFVGVLVPVQDAPAPMPTWVRSWVAPPRDANANC